MRPKRYRGNFFPFFIPIKTPANLFNGKVRDLKTKSEKACESTMGRNIGKKQLLFVNLSRIEGSKSSMAERIKRSSFFSPLGGPVNAVHKLRNFVGIFDRPCEYL